MVVFVVVDVEVDEEAEQEKRAALDWPPAYAERINFFNHLVFILDQNLFVVLDI